MTGRYRGHERLGNRPGKGGADVLDLSDRVRVKDYLSPHSDLVALLVLEHQAEGHNRIARAGMLTRVALAVEADMNKALGEPAGNRLDSTTSRIRAACEPLVEYLLFSGEAWLAGPVSGTSAFAAEFSARGPKDKGGRSVREFDLTVRLFKHSLSYLVYTEPFRKLPPEARGYVLGRLHDVLSGKDATPPFAHLTAADRRATLRIAQEAFPDLPAYWQ